MDENEINYKSLRRIQQAEQASSALTKIHGEFYQDLSSYLKNLEQTVENEKSPQKLKLFSDEISNTKKIANSIYEFREKKIVQAALATARGATPDLGHLLDVEKKLYDTLVEQIMLSRKEIFEAVPHQPHQHKQVAFKPPLTPPKESNINPIVCVVEDTPEFVGTDMKTYSLRKEDVLSLPKEMSAPLLKKGMLTQVK
jgi:DNA replication initiation complex subunit (GINS family)